MEFANRAKLADFKSLDGFLTKGDSIQLHRLINYFYSINPKLLIV